VTVPETIRDIIAARVDRLTDSPKRTLQVASVVGRRFGVSLVSHVRETQPEQVAGDLQNLHAVDFVFPSAHDPEVMYSFKHALTQDVVYTTLLERRRRQFHAAAGQGLEALYAGRIADVVEVLAYHFSRGQVWDKAVAYHRQAAAKAQARSAHREAVASLEEALEGLRHLPETPETREQNIDVRLELRSSLYALGEFEKMLGCLREAEAMASAISDSRRLASIAIHNAEYFRQTGQFAEARELGEKALALGDKLQDVPLRLYASHYLGLACHALGDYGRAAQLLQTVARSPEAEWPAGWFRATVSGSWAAFQAVTLSWLARCLSERGEFEEGLDAGHRAVTFAEGLGSPYSLAAACIGAGHCALVKGDLDAAGPVLERACRVAREANLALYRPQATRLLGATYLLAGRIDEGLAMVREAAGEVESRRLLMQQAAVLALLGEACLFAGRLEEASSVAERALGLARERGQRGDEAAALHALGEATARGSDVDRAEHYYLEEIALAGELEMRPLLARGHLGIGRLYLHAGGRDRAEDHLLTATRMFIAMDMPLWVRQAASALSELGRLLIVAGDHRSLYEYLNRALGPGGPLRVILDAPGEGREFNHGLCRPHVETMLQSHGLSVSGSE
jgi:tetratricopeptide (TPR) repeat protein